MKAILVRIGVDHSYGGWNAPADPVSRRFVYVPIPEHENIRFRPECSRHFQHVLPAMEGFASDFGLDSVVHLGWPSGFERKAMHLDPDFDHLTYGDVGDRRGSHIRTMARGDLIVFYAGLRSIRPTDRQLIYALVGLYVVDEIVLAADVKQPQWNENAHTRKINHGASDIVVRAIRGRSGRLDRFIPIGEYRERAYRVTKTIEQRWGGLTVRNGYLQRSARPPRFLKPRQFLRWFEKQGVSLIEQSNPSEQAAGVVLVLLRRPDRANPLEMRSDPFWEFGSFGCTGCHSTNLMNPDRIDELQGVRFAFAQGGPSGFRLVKVTPPITVVKHAQCAEARWSPANMPFRYSEAPLLIDNSGKSDVAALRKLVANVNRTTWEGRFSSKFRSRRELLPAEVAQQILSTFDNASVNAKSAALAGSYAEALPYPPPCIDNDRQKSYHERLLAIQQPGTSNVRRSGKKCSTRSAGGKRRRKGC